MQGLTGLRRAGTIRALEPEAPPAARPSMQHRDRQLRSWEGVDVTRLDKLYEGYSELKRVAQNKSIQLDAPVIVVVGHQTDGKSGDQRILARVLYWDPRL